jgi:hypothetical protein
MLVGLGMRSVSVLRDPQRSEGDAATALRGNATLELRSRVTGARQPGAGEAIASSRS